MPCNFFKILRPTLDITVTVFELMASIPMWAPRLATKISNTEFAWDLLGLYECGSVYVYFNIQRSR